MPSIFRPDAVTDPTIGDRTNTFGEPVPRPPATSPNEIYRGLPGDDSDLQFEQQLRPPPEWIPGADQGMERGGVPPRGADHAKRALYRLTSVDHDPFAPYQLAPVDHDPFEAAAARVRAPYAKANARASGLPQVLDYFGDKLASAVTAPRDAMTGKMQVNDPATGMPTPEALQRAQGVVGIAMTGGIPMAQRGAAGIFGGKLGKATEAATQPEGITAFHGSPYNFDRFDISKIGTGEGAQAYGNGLYFAENESVAKDYANKVLRKTPITKEEYRVAKEAGLPLNKGRTYEVAIKAPPEHFLDWDKPLSEQHPKVREALESHPEEYVAKFARQADPNMSGESLARYLGSDVMREAGIPGIKYLDQGSRGAPAQIDHLQRQVSGLEDILRQSPEREDVKNALAGRRAELAQAQKATRNYVVFDDKLIDILKKYGIAGIGALPAAGGYHFQTNAVDHDPFAP